MPPKKSTGRDTSSFKDNVTASLQLIHKNANANDNSFVYELATTGAGLAFEHLVKPAFGYVKDSFFKPEPTVSILPPVPKQPKQISSEELKQRQIETEAPSVKLREQTKIYEDQIKKLFEEKKLIDAKERKIAAENKANQSKKTISPRESERRLNLLAQIDDLQVKKLEFMGPLITEHATKRVDLMFLLMIAIYKRNLIIGKGPTDRQHGKGSTDLGTAACHVSFIPHPVFYKPKSMLALSGMTDYVSNYALSLFSNQYALSQNQASSDLSNLEEVDFLKGCYLQDVLNMTTELPKVVNDFDGYMEGKFDRSKAIKSILETLNQVSRGELDPIQGISEFGTIMSTLFSHIQYNYFLIGPQYKANSTVPYPKAFEKVWQYQQQGTLSMFTITTKAIQNSATDKHTEAKVNPNYVYLMLGLQQLSTQERLTRFIYSGPIEKRILEMQQEILSSKSEFDKRNIEPPEPLQPSGFSQFLKFS